MAEASRVCFFIFLVVAVRHRCFSGVEIARVASSAPSLLFDFAPSTTFPSCRIGRYSILIGSNDGSSLAVKVKTCYRTVHKDIHIFFVFSGIRKSEMPRPELQAPPEIFYNDTEARKYTTSSRIIEIQAKISERALELLNIPNDGIPRLLLDIGCGSGLSGETLSENEHRWIGFDISQSMLDVALEREVEGDLLLADMGQGLGLRPGVIDGAISISAIQWLCYADKSSHEPIARLKAFFGSLYRCLTRGSRAVLQLYSENMNQSEMIMKAAMRAGFAGGVVVDFPHRYVYSILRF
ncbi:hypothetical protein M5K25_026758 [Dendrobium thyrsiflorum]|uniref:Methyltransferase type 11 domain-containing protein n=1 Tax=Dendrobium thyrsiflorum TaxID=117978 RepID=A0ABD0TYA6_DENTH